MTQPIPSAPAAIHRSNAVTVSVAPTSGNVITAIANGPDDLDYVPAPPNTIHSTRRKSTFSVGTVGACLGNLACLYAAPRKSL